MKTCILPVPGYAEPLILVLQDDGSVTWRKVTAEDVSAVFDRSSAVNAADTIKIEFEDTKK